MDTTQIPQTLPPAITINRETAVACMADDLGDYGISGPVALAWQWALTGKGPTPIALETWNQGPPSHNMLLDESRWPHASRWQGHANWEEIQRARFLLWWLTAAEDEQLPARFRRCDIASQPNVAEHGSITVTMTKTHRGEAFGRSTEGATEPHPRCRATTPAASATALSAPSAAPTRPRSFE